MTTELERLTRALGATYRIERELGAGLAAKDEQMR